VWQVSNNQKLMNLCRETDIWEIWKWRLTCSFKLGNSADNLVTYVVYSQHFSLCGCAGVRARALWWVLCVGSLMQTRTYVHVVLLIQHATHSHIVIWGFSGSTIFYDIS
jgi:hypothetical protein